MGAVYTLLDTYYSFRGRIFLGRYPLSISVMEALFVGLLCYYDRGVESHFRYYYILSLLCCAIRHSPLVTYTTCALHCLSYGLLYLTGRPMHAGMSRWLLVIALSTSTMALSRAISASLHGGGSVEVHFDVTPGRA